MTCSFSDLKRMILIATFAVLPLTAVSASAQASAAECGSSMQTTVQPKGSSIQGSATLCIEPDHITATVSSENHTPGDAYTVWFAYIDDPSQCGYAYGGTPGVCSSKDFTLPADSPIGVFGRMDGNVAGPSGKLGFTGRFQDLRFSHGSMVWLIMFGHGPASTTDNRLLARQLLTPQLSTLGAPGLGATADEPTGPLSAGHPVALAVFNIP